jgi:hypothetical protein
MDSANQPATPAPGNHEPANLGDILERVLDRGLVIAGDIRISLLDIELLTVKLRLLVASVDTAKELGIDWWEHDPWLTSSSRRELSGARRGELGAAPESDRAAAADATARAAAAIEEGSDEEEER